MANKANLRFHRWPAHSECFFMSSLWGFPPSWRWEDAASCQEVLPLISFLSHRYLLIHPLGLMSSRRKFRTHSLFCAPEINSSRVMWPVKFRVGLQDKKKNIYIYWKILFSKFFLFNGRLNTHRHCWRRPPGRCAGTPLLTWGLPLRRQQKRSLSLFCRWSERKQDF